MKKVAALEGNKAYSQTAGGRRREGEWKDDGEGGWVAQKRRQKEGQG